jgi:hypothetical protein
MSNELLTYWLTASRDFNGHRPALSIRIEFSDLTGVTRSAMGDYDGGEIEWTGGCDVPDALCLAARDCADDAGEFTDIPGCTFAGTETADEMMDAIDSLFESHRFIAAMAQPVVPGTVEWFRAAGAI